MSIPKKCQRCDGKYYYGIERCCECRHFGKLKDNFKPIVKKP